MGKGFNNYMCKKPFHPGSKANIKRAWMAEQKTENEKRKQEELKLQYEKEQELYHNRALLSKESKDKLGLNFMYEAPPGAKKEHQKEDNEPEYKFEWQRKYNAPREDFARGNAEIRDQPFGIQVRNVRCIKCHKWGHINTDKECPLYNKAGGAGDSSAAMDPSELMRRMKEEEGLALKQSILGHRIDPSLPNQQLLSSKENEEEDVEMQFLKSLSTKQKEKLLKKLEKLEKGPTKKSHKKKFKKRQKKKKGRKKSSSDSTDSESEVDSKKKAKKIKRHRKSHSDSSSDSSQRKQKTKHDYQKKSLKRPHEHSTHPNKRCRSPDRYTIRNYSPIRAERSHSPDTTDGTTKRKRHDHSPVYKKSKSNSEHAH